MCGLKTARLLMIALPFLCAAAQSRPGAQRAESRSAQNSKVHDKNWFRDQVRKRYGTSAVPQKSDPAAGDKKTAPKSNQQTAGK